MNWRSYTLKSKSELGVADLLAVVIGLPVILMIVAFLYSLLQGPYVQRGMRGALSEITSRAASEAAKDSNLGVRPIDLSEPAGNLIDPIGGALTANTTNAGPGILNSKVAQSLVTEACKLSTVYLNGFVNSDRAYEFGIVKLYPEGSTASNASLNVEIEYSQVCPQNSLSSADLKSDVFSVAKAADQLKARFRDIPSRGSGLWELDQFSRSANGDSLVKYLPSYWMIGVVTGRTTPLATTFFGSSKFISEYAVHPFSAPVGIEQAGSESLVSG